MIKSHNKVVGKVVARHRKAKRVTQKEIAERLGWGRSTVSNMERGDIGMGVDDFTAYCKAIGEDPIEILREIIDEAR